MPEFKKKYGVTVKLTDEEKQKLDLICKTKHRTRSSLIREFIDEGMQVYSYKKDKDLISNMIKESIFEALNPKMERMIALQVKSCTTSASAYYLVSDVMQRVLNTEQRIGVKDAIERAKKEGVKFAKLKEELGE